jgi:hypothetical protein
VASTTSAEQKVFLISLSLLTPPESCILALSLLRLVRRHSVFPAYRFFCLEGGGGESFWFRFQEVFPGSPPPPRAGGEGGTTHSV